LVVRRNTLDLGITDPGGVAICPSKGVTVNSHSSVMLCKDNVAGTIDIVGSGFYKGL